MSPTLQSLRQHLLLCFEEGIDIILWAENTPCRIAWPLYEDGRPVRPFDLPAWLTQRKLVWTCLCAADNGHGACLARFRIHRDGSTLALCGGVDTRCAFKLDLTSICAQTHLRDTYPFLTTGITSSEYWNALEEGARLALNHAPGIDGLEGVYYGWCGFYDSDVQNVVEYW